MATSTPHVQLTVDGSGGRQHEHGDADESEHWDVRQATSHPLAVRMASQIERRSAAASSDAGGDAFDGVEVIDTDEWSVLPFVLPTAGATSGAVGTAVAPSHEPPTAAAAIEEGGKLGWVLVHDGSTVALPTGALALSAQDVESLHPRLRLRLGKSRTRGDATPLLMKAALDPRVTRGYDTTDAFGRVALTRVAKRVAGGAGHVASWWALEKAKARELLLPAGSSATNRGAVFNMANSIVGAGILGLALFGSKLGYVGAPIMLFAMAYLTQFMMTHVVAAGAAEKCDSYGQLCYAVLGRGAGTALQWLLTLTTVGTLIAYIVLIGDFVVIVASEFMAPEQVWRKTIVAAIAAMLIFPLTLRRDLNGLRFASFVSVMFVAFFAVAVYVRGFEIVAERGTWGGSLGTLHALPTSGFAFFESLPVATFAFSCATSVFPVYASIQSSRQRDFKKVMRAAVPLVYVLYASVCVFAYLVFGEDGANGNILATFGNYGTSKLMALTTALFAFTIVFTFPLVAFATRVSLHYLLVGPRDASHIQHFLETVAIVGVATGVGTTVDNVATVFGFVGAVGSATLSLTIPATLVLTSPAYKTRLSTLQRAVAIGVVVYGVTLTVGGVWTNISSLE